MPGISVIPLVIDGKAWTLLSVVEVAMTDDESIRVRHLEFLQQGMKGSLLCISPGVSRSTVCIQPTLIAHTNGM